ncbi:MAG: hypothetical protein O3B21_11600 [Proteobacteria bacterium]|nr:hypothetical protein [Pseudomonadota bacterium]MDA1356158.1 hypothetical protein [Pseudomonadota bacterium]
MKIFFTTLLLALLLPLLSSRADVADGVRAYDAGWYAEAVAEFLPAAEAGDVRAQLALASMYQFGEGVPQNDVGAARWTRGAAERGDPVAQINLSQFFAAGRGVRRDVAESYFWLLLAAGQGNNWAQVRLAAAAVNLPNSAASAVQARAANWTPFGDDLTGPPEVLDGQTLSVDGRRLRLEGITAPPLGTRCQLRGNEHDCGRISTTALMDLTAGATVTCIRREIRAADGSRFARCRAGGYDLSEGMVYTGWAEADGTQMTRYAALEVAARQARRGMWRRN